MEVVTGPDSIRDQRLEQLVEQYQQVVLRMCYLYLHDAEQAKDATQESFLKAYLALGAFRGECSDKTWLMRIAINTCRDMRRSAWFRYLDRRITPDQLPEAVIQPQEEDVELTLAVMKLPHKFKEVILLYYYQNMTSQEIAVALGTGQSTVSTRLKQARCTLRKMLEGGAMDGSSR
ncbi:MAG: sigma-70 family RNA polymerase sigma factor [Clostridia bacterium]